MTPPPLPSPDDLTVPRVFPRLAGGRSLASLTFGVAAFIVAALGFAIGLRTDPGPLPFQLMTTLPTLAGLALIARARQSRDRLRAVAADAEGLTLDLAGGPPRRIAWPEIAWNSEGLQPLSNVPRCTLYGTDGRVLARIPATLDRFGELVALIDRRVKRDATPTAEAVRRGRLRRQAPLVFGFGVLMFLVFSFVLWSDLDERRRERLLAGSAIDGLATVERKFTAPDGRTRRVEYRVDATRPDGTRPDAVNAELEPFAWELVREGGKLPVAYVPAEPDVSRLAIGQRPDRSRLGVAERVVLFGGGTVLTLFCLAFGVLNGFGIDLVLDSETKRPRIARSVAN